MLKLLFGGYVHTYAYIDKTPVRPGQTYHATDVKGRKEVERTLIASGHGHVSDLTMPTRTALE